MAFNLGRFLDDLFGRRRPRPTPPVVPPPPPPPEPVPEPEPAPEPDPPPVVAPVTPPPNLGRVIRVTQAGDGEFLNRTYSYWSNAVVIGDDLFVFAGHVDGHPRFFKVDELGNVTPLGALLDYGGTGEGWYWDALVPGGLFLCEGPRLRRVNPFNGDDRVVFDISAEYPGCRIWQAHSSDDGLVHSATIERVTAEGAYPKLGTVVYRRRQLEFFPAIGVLDESQVTPDGRHLIIKERGNDNRFIESETRETWWLTDEDRALGHSDCGPGFVVGEADKPDPGACVYYDLRTRGMRILFPTLNMGHVSVRGQRCLLSNERHLSLVDLQSGAVTALLAHGMTGGGYEHQVHANLSPCGTVACWVSNVAGRFDMYVVRL